MVLLLAIVDHLFKSLEARNNKIKRLGSIDSAKARARDVAFYLDRVLLGFILTTIGYEYFLK